MTTTDPTIALAVDAQNLLFREARTANAFTDEPVEDAQLRAIYDLVRWAPTSLNCQPLRIVAVRSAAARARLVPHMADGNQHKVAAAPLTLLLAADHAFDVHLPRLVPFLDDPAAMFTDPAVRSATADYNATLQVAYLLLGVRAAGLAAGPMAGFDAAGINHEFFPEGRLHISLVMTVGHPAPDAWLERLPRLTFDEVVSTI